MQTNNEEKRDFIGLKKVSVILDTGRKTPMGNPILEVSFEDNTSEMLTEKMLKASLSADPIDYTSLRELRCKPLVAEILVLMGESNIKASEIQYVMDMIIMSIDQNFNRATNRLWNVEDPGDRTFLMADDILRKDGSDQEKAE